MFPDPFAQLLKVAADGVQVRPVQLFERGELTKAAIAAGITKSGMWCRWNAHKIDRAKKAAQAKSWREGVMRPEWLSYCDAHAVMWPKAVPCGFGRWIKERHYLAWRQDPAAFLAVPNDRSLFSSFDAWDRAGRRSGRA